jgi:hypothetical protein
MKFGTIVIVERGSEGIPNGRPGCKRNVFGTLVFARGHERWVKLLQDDPFDSLPQMGWNKKGAVGNWSASVVKDSLGALVEDRWWPNKTGRIVKRTKTTLRIMWGDGVTDKYDKAHFRFLRFV